MAVSFIGLGGLRFDDAGRTRGGGFGVRHINGAFAQGVFLQAHSVGLVAGEHHFGGSSESLALEALAGGEAEGDFAQHMAELQLILVSRIELQPVATGGSLVREVVGHQEVFVQHLGAVGGHGPR